jgi:hypothetical protein
VKITEQTDTAVVAPNSRLVFAAGVRGWWLAATSVQKTRDAKIGWGT